MYIYIYITYAQTQARRACVRTHRTSCTFLLFENVGATGSLRQVTFSWWRFCEKKMKISTDVTTDFSILGISWKARQLT